MSLSSRSSTRSSILKKSTTLEQRLSEIVQSPTKVRFELPHSKRVKEILEEYINQQEVRNYQSLVCAIRDSSLTDSDILSLLQEATQCISLLTRDLRLFVDALLSINWVEKSLEVVNEYQSFIVNLVSAHNYHTKYVVDKLVSLFLPSPKDPEWTKGKPTKKEKAKCMHVHLLLNVLLSVVPMCKEILFKAINMYYPYYNKSTHTQEYYLHNLLQILKYQPSFRPDIFNLIFTKLVTMDVNAPKDILQQNYEDEDLFAMDDDSKSIVSSRTAFTNVNRIALCSALDVCMDMMLKYIEIECHDSKGELDWEKTKSLYNDMIHTFDKIILPTYNTNYVQFVMFVLCSLKSTLTEAFFSYLWKKVCNPNVAGVLRQTAITYIASMIARANFVTLTMIKSSLREISDWIHTYVTNQDGLESINCDVRVHSVFYSVCQALFYVIAFRHKDLITTKKNIMFLESLNLTKIVTSRLNPLRVCQKAVVQNFAAVTRKYQLAYCYTIIDHNNRNTMPLIYQDEKGSSVISNNVLSDFYPFDPYILERSSRYIRDLYIEYDNQLEESPSTEADHREAMEVDDFLESNQEANSSKSLQRFSYGSSPGFKFK
ncbi:RNA polymerase I-specific transcription initiation factor RRN3 isoform X2 [Cylas formicarius]|uniref:RNA polymerase I-specific transcription initiation factor RRN3 isoform X2 n=1 Tax=Cylas formicarius TaxID=197179 RepID=UPI0029585CA7|nr:RNA polymerase I-specific transcription initiation factor RRN3 isoform X2 [Cylas formicarius]